MKSDVRLLGTSTIGTEALIPEALGISRWTLEVICDEMYCWTPNIPHKRTDAVAKIATVLIFIGRTYLLKLFKSLATGENSL